MTDINLVHECVEAYRHFSHVFVVRRLIKNRDTIRRYLSLCTNLLLSRGCSWVPSVSSRDNTNTLTSGKSGF
jgi:hypothetical protein